MIKTNTVTLATSRVGPEVSDITSAVHVLVHEKVAQNQDLTPTSLLGEVWMKLEDDYWAALEKEADAKV